MQLKRHSMAESNSEHNSPPEPEDTETTISVNEFLFKRDKTLFEAVYQEGLGRGIDGDLLNKMLMKAYNFHRDAWNDDQPQEIKKALDQTQVPTPKPVDLSRFYPQMKKSK
jgi:hypothetical protein